MMIKRTDDQQDAMAIRIQDQLKTVEIPTIHQMTKEIPTSVHQD
jgi:hypothetical protein